VPIAGLAEYALSNRSSVLDLLPVTSMDFIHTFRIGAYYSGQPNLQLGIVGGFAGGLPQLTSS
jgi:hypothetical protein